MQEVTTIVDGYCQQAIERCAATFSLPRPHAPNLLELVAALSSHLSSAVVSPVPSLQTAGSPAVVSPVVMLPLLLPLQQVQPAPSKSPVAVAAMVPPSAPGTPVIVEVATSVASSGSRRAHFAELDAEDAKDEELPWICVSHLILFCIIVLLMQLSATCVPSARSRVSSSQVPPTPMRVVPASSVATRVCTSPTDITSVMLKNAHFCVRAVIRFWPVLLALPVCLTLLALLQLLTSSNHLGTLAWTLLALPTTYLLVVISTFLVLSRLAPPYSGPLRLLVLKVTIWQPSSTCSSLGVCSASR